MKLSSAISRFLFIVLCSVQQNMCMKRAQTIAKFDVFTQLLPEVQDNIFRCVEQKGNFQLLNKYWSKRASIASSQAFDNDLAGLSKERIICILLHAAYQDNYEGVENILKNSSLVQCIKDGNKCNKGHILYYYIDTMHGRKIIDFHEIVNDKKETKWLDLLKIYHIVQAPHSLEKMVPTPLVMSCLAGNSHIITTIPDTNKDRKSEHLKDALYIAVNNEYYSCVKMLIDDLYHDISWDDIGSHIKTRKALLTLPLLQFACMRKNVKIIEEILKTKEFDLNKIDITAAIQKTFLDNVIEDAHKNDEYKHIAALLRKYGAKTLQELQKATEEDNDIAGRIFLF